MVAPERGRKLFLHTIVAEIDREACVSLHRDPLHLDQRRFRTNQVAVGRRSARDFGEHGATDIRHGGAGNLTALCRLA